MRPPDDSSEHPKPVVEPSTGEAPDLTTRALHLRIRQQEILAELGVLALQGTQFADLLNHTVRLTAEGMEAEFCKMLEFVPADNRLLVRAGFRRIIEPPMDRHGARKYRTLLFGSIANRDDVIEGLPQEVIKRFGGMMAHIDADLFHCFDASRM